MLMKVLFEKEGACSGHVPSEEFEPNIPKKFLRGELPLPQLGEVEVVRHFTNLSRKNFGVDIGFYPLGSCTMKYNPKISEDACRLEGFLSAHPLAPASAVQGALQLLWETEQYLSEITGMDAFSLQPAAGSHGELTCVMVAKKHFRGQRRTVIIPDSAHGTNPASAALCGFNVKSIKSAGDGGVDLEALKEAVDSDTALLMLTNPSTLGLFENRVKEITEIVHDAGGLVFCDGANLNAMLGITRPGDQGFDMMHINLHKTFSTPHGGGGPGSGPVGVKKELEKYLPVPRVVKKGELFELEWEGKESIGKVRGFWGNFGVIVRAYAYIRATGPELKDAAEKAVLNANYLMKKLVGYYDLPYKRTCAHEFVLSADRQVKNGVHAMDIAKRLIDYGFHPPTIYFPLIVSEALMIEPTETEDRETLDAFVDAMAKIAKEAEENPAVLHEAPHATPVKRLDGVLAARKPNLKWEK